MPASGPLALAVAEAVQAAKLPTEDAGAVALAEHYAAAIDAAGGTAEALTDLGPKLLAALSALGLTTTARAVKGGTEIDASVSKLDELRARREQRDRANGTAPMDAATS